MLDSAAGNYVEGIVLQGGIQENGKITLRSAQMIEQSGFRPLSPAWLGLSRNYRHPDLNCTVYMEKMPLKNVPKQVSSSYLDFAISSSDALRAWADQKGRENRGHENLEQLFEAQLTLQPKLVTGENENSLMAFDLETARSRTMVGVHKHYLTRVSSIARREVDKLIQEALLPAPNPMRQIARDVLGTLAKDAWKFAAAEAFDRKRKIVVSDRIGFVHMLRKYDLPYDPAIIEFEQLGKHEALAIRLYRSGKGAGVMCDLVDTGVSMYENEFIPAEEIAESRICVITRRLDIDREYRQRMEGFIQALRPVNANGIATARRSEHLVA